MGAARTVRAGSDVTADVCIIGAGVAGLVTALDIIDAAPTLHVIIIDKGAIGATGSTPLAQGGMAAAIGDGDDPGRHAADTERAGAGLCDPEAVAVLAAEAPARVTDLLRRGARFDRHADGSFDLAREGGQSVARSVRAADASGAEIFRALRVAATGRITRLQGIAVSIARDETTTPTRACGVWMLLDEVEASSTGPPQEGGVTLIRAPVVVLAAGGCGGLFAATTNRDGATGDGLALGHEAGAALADCEFVQFHPTGLRVADGTDSYWRLLLTEALRGAGAHLIDAEGTRFLSQVHPDAELAPRHVVTKAILSEPRGAWLDARHLGHARLAREFPTVLAGAAAHGFDLANEPVPVEPAAHFLIGGVATDLSGQTTVPGLFAVGESAATGTHGANRMAGNSLAEACVFGHRAARRVLATTWTPVDGVDPVPPTFGANEVIEPAALTARKDRLRRALSAGIGPVRNDRSVREAEAALDEAALGGPPPADPRAIELTHAVTCGRLICVAAGLRRESRGVHTREDFPDTDSQWDGVHLRLGHDTASTVERTRCSTL